MVFINMEIYRYMEWYECKNWIPQCWLQANWLLMGVFMQGGTVTIFEYQQEAMFIWTNS